MKKFFLFLFIALIAFIFVGTAVFLYQKSNEEPVVFETESAFFTDIVKKTVATGKIIPRHEVEIKSQVSGVVKEIYVIPGETINKGDLLAKIEIIPNMQQLNSAESQLETARLNFENAKRELEQQKMLFEKNLISEFDYNKFLLGYQLQREAASAAENNVDLIKDGASKNADKVSNIVWATLSGTVLDVPVKLGTFVTETNTFNAGTTIATIADMSDMIFEGQVDESEVGKIKEGMDLLLDIGAVESEPFTAVLEYISPKGVDDQGTIKFEIRAAVTLQDDQLIRAGYSANADIVLDKRDEALAINEANLIIEGSETFVEVETSEQQFEKRKIVTGLSDGINIEVVSGLTQDEKIKKL